MERLDLERVAAEQDVAQTPAPRVPVVHPHELPTIGAGASASPMPTTPSSSWISTTTVSAELSKSSGSLSGRGGRPPRSATTAMDSRAYCAPTAMCESPRVPEQAISAVVTGAAAGLGLAVARR